MVPLILLAAVPAVFYICKPMSTKEGNRKMVLIINDEIVLWSAVVVVWIATVWVRRASAGDDIQKVKRRRPKAYNYEIERREKRLKRKEEKRRRKEMRRALRKHQQQQQQHGIKGGSVDVTKTSSATKPSNSSKVAAADYVPVLDHDHSQDDEKQQQQKKRHEEKVIEVDLLDYEYDNKSDFQLHMYRSVTSKYICTQGYILYCIVYSL